MIRVGYFEKQNKNISDDYLIRRDRNNHFFIKEYLKRLDGSFSDISTIEIETISGCNGICSFCPVNRLYDKREQVKMDMNLFHKIIDYLSEKQYKGYISYFSNNEPLLDDRILSMIEYGKNKLPDAVHSLYTNGILLNQTLFQKLTELLDRLTIDNYSNSLKLHSNISKLLEMNRDVDCDVRIMVRRSDEILDSRAGNAPNRIHNIKFQSTCLLPFTQLIFKPTGDMTICCQDSYGKVSFGNIQSMSIDEILEGEKRKKVLDLFRTGGRENLSYCEFCDLFGTVNYHMNDSFVQQMKESCISLYRDSLKLNGKKELRLTSRDKVTDRMKSFLESNGLKVQYAEYSETDPYFYLFPLYQDAVLRKIDPLSEKTGKNYLISDILYYLCQKEMEYDDYEPDHE